MREYSFPDYYTEWDTLRDIKSGDIENVKAYLSAINDNNYIKAGAALAKLKNKVLQTADWQERFDTVCEMHQYMDTVTEANNYNQTQHLVNTKYTDKLPSGAEEQTERMKPIVGNLWFDTSYGIIPCTKLTASTTSITLYKYQSGIVYVDIIPVPYNTTDTIALSATTAGVSLKDKGRRLALDSSAMALTTTYKSITVKITTEGRTSISVTIKVYVLEPRSSAIVIDASGAGSKSTVEKMDPHFYIIDKEGTATEIWNVDTGNTTAEFKYNEKFKLNFQDVDDFTSTSNGNQRYHPYVYVNGALQSPTEINKDNAGPVITKYELQYNFDPSRRIYSITFELTHTDYRSWGGYYDFNIYIYTTEI